MRYDYSKTDIAKGVGISQTTLSSGWENLERNGLVKETREIGRAKMYKLNLDSPVVRKFIELDNAICDLYASQLERQEAVSDSQENESNQRHILAWGTFIGNEIVKNTSHCHRFRIRVTITLT